MELPQPPPLLQTRASDAPRAWQHAGNCTYRSLTYGSTLELGEENAAERRPDSLVAGQRASLSHYTHWHFHRPRALANSLEHLKTLQKHRARLRYYDMSLANQDIAAAPSPQYHQNHPSSQWVNSPEFIDILSRSLVFLHRLIVAWGDARKHTQASRLNREINIHYSYCSIQTRLARST